MQIRSFFKVHLMVWSFLCSHRKEISTERAESNYKLCLATISYSENIFCIYRSKLPFQTVLLTDVFGIVKISMLAGDEEARTLPFTILVSV